MWNSKIAQHKQRIKVRFKLTLVDYMYKVRDITRALKRKEISIDLCGVCMGWMHKGMIEERTAGSNPKIRYSSGGPISLDP